MQSCISHKKDSTNFQLCIIHTKDSTNLQLCIIHTKNSTVVQSCIAHTKDSFLLSQICDIQRVRTTALWIQSRLQNEEIWSSPVLSSSFLFASFLPSFLLFYSSLSSSFVFSWFFFQRKSKTLCKTIQIGIEVQWIPLLTNSVITKFLNFWTFISFKPICF